MPTHREIAARRTLALVGPSAAGKTSLAEALLWKAGAIGSPGSVDKGSTVADFDPLEKRALRSLNAALVHFEHLGIRTHLIDTPGAPDFLGQSLPALEAVETAAVVINAPADKIYTVLCDSSTWRQLRPSTAVIKNPISKDHVKTVQFSSTTFRPNDTENQVSILPIMEDDLGYQVQWHSRVKLKWYPWEKFRGLFLEKVIGQAYESTLQNIKKILEAKPAN